MAINFPDNPSNGDTHEGYTYNSTKNTWTPSATTGTEPPVILTEPPTTTQSLNTDGTTSTVTMTAQDPEGFDVTYGIAYKTAGNTLPSQLASATTINQSTGVYTFTPSTTVSNAGSFTARLSATDGIGYTTRLVNFNLHFGFQLWRLYANTGSSYGLWDIDNATGITLGNGTQLSTSQSLVSVKNSVLSAGEYGTYRSSSANPFTANTSNGPWDANSGPGPGSFFNGGRLAWGDGAGHWIGIYLSTPIQLSDMSGGSVNLRTYVGGRPTRCPQQIYLQYYDGVLGSNYSTSNWVTYATLNSAQTAGNPTWTNITQGSTKNV